MDYIKIDDNTLGIQEIRETITKDELLAKKSTLTSQLEQPEPTQSELLEYARNSHPYYAGKMTMQSELNNVNELLAILES